MQRYIAFLRGVNVGGHGLIKMSELKTCFESIGLADVKTFIQSGNILFGSSETEKAVLTDLITEVIKKDFHLTVELALFTHTEWRDLIAAAPNWWGKNIDWRHNIFIVINPNTANSIALQISPLTADEKLKTGNQVLYQSIDREAIGRGATGSKLISKKVYKLITIRNYNTANKINALLNEYV